MPKGHSSAFELYLTAMFGVVGFILMKSRLPGADCCWGFVLGPMMEENPAPTRC